MWLKTREIVEGIEELMKKKPDLLQEEESIKADLAGGNGQITALQQKVEMLTTTKGDIEQRLETISAERRQTMIQGLALSVNTEIACLAMDRAAAETVIGQWNGDLDRLCKERELLELRLQELQIELHRISFQERLKALRKRQIEAITRWNEAMMAIRKLGQEAKPIMDLIPRPHGEGFFRRDLTFYPPNIYNPDTCPPEWDMMGMRPKFSEEALFALLRDSNV